MAIWQSIVSVYKTIKLPIVLFMYPVSLISSVTTSERDKRTYVASFVLT